jgi:hypothetical protein
VKPAAAPTAPAVQQAYHVDTGRLAIDHGERHVYHDGILLLLSGARSSSLR